MFSKTVQKPVHEIFQKQKKVADVGIELEIEGNGLPENIPHWQTKSEGSLQQGQEYITKPIKEDAVVTYVNGLAKYIQDSGATINNTYRCSTHIHVNFLNSNFEDLLGMVVIFTMFEPILLSLCGPQRDGNLFCLSSYDTGDLTASFDNLCGQIDRIETHGFGYERGKYSSLNLGRLTDLGTAEARCFPLSVKGEEVHKWVSWLLTMRDTATAQPDKSFRNYWKAVRQSPLWYANKIFGPDVYSLPNIHVLVELGTENAYELTKILKKWYSAKEEKPATPAKVRKAIKFGMNPNFNEFTFASGPLSSNTEL